MIEKGIFVLFIFLHDKIITLPKKSKKLKTCTYMAFGIFTVFFFTSFMKGNLIFLHILNVILV